MESLTALGYRVIVVWECDIEGDLSAVVRYVEALFESAI
jgi:G:T-mismatch repair DNA endonuclease (very short patch repair protein)